MSSVTTSPVTTGPIPHRKQIREWLRALPGRSTGRALTLLAADAALLGLALTVVVRAHGLPLKLLAGSGAGLIIARLFVIGHDACHQSLTVHRRLNALIGRLAFLPSLTPYSLWDIGHNVVHHGYTHLKGFDFIWQPASLEEYRAMPPPRRALERFYRSGWGCGLYYLIEVWWLRLWFPDRRRMPTRRLAFRLDSLLVGAFALAWIAGLALAARATGQPALRLVTTGGLLPFLVWNWIMGFVVYVHHTHPDIGWHHDKARWSAARPFVSTTVHLRFRRRFGIDMGAVLHHITEHTAHHVDMTIPLYRLRAAQAMLEAHLPNVITVQDFSWRWYFDTARRCKLYDRAADRWTDFEGRASR